MPSLDYLEDNQDNPCVSGSWLVEQIRADSRKAPVLLVDCRSAADHHRHRLSGSINISLPASLLMLRRLSNGKLKIPSLIRDENCRQKFISMWKNHTVVLYHGDGEDFCPRFSQCVLGTLFRRLEQDGCNVVCLQGGFSRFSEDFPEWCETASDGDAPIDASLLGLETLRITPSNSSPSSSATSTSSGSESECDSGLLSGVGGGGGPGGRGPEGGGGIDPPFPVEIVPYLYLGNADNAGDLSALERHRILHVLNVTPNLPNAFEKQGIRYLQIPIEDHWSQNLASFFPQAIAFIDEARLRRQGVLVHCLAGVSRSVTVTLAYLMRTLRLPLNDAYERVRRRKANISPNFHFLGQLLDYEGQLRLTSPLAPPSLTHSVDSSIVGPQTNPTGSVTGALTVVTTSTNPETDTSPGSIGYDHYPCTCSNACPCACNARRGHPDLRSEQSGPSGSNTPMSAPPCPCSAQTSTLYFTSPAHATPDSGIDVDRWTE